MRKHRSVLRKVVSLAALLGLLISFTFLSSTQVTHAASHSNNVRPYCSGSVWASPSDQDIEVHLQAVVTVYWTCEGSFHVVANIDWRDGQTDNYTCWANCNTNNNRTTFTHIYNRTGSFNTHIWMNGSASGSTSAYIVVSD